MRRSGVLAACVAVFLGGCVRTQAGDEPPVSGDQAPTRPTSRPRPNGNEAMMRPAALEAMMHDAPAEYAVRDLRAYNAQHGLELVFETGGARLASADGDRREVTLSLAAVGREPALSPVAAAAPVVVDGRVEYRRGDVVEWYRHGPPGVEQGFDVGRRPEGSGPLVLDVQVRGGLTAELSDDGATVALVDGDGRARLRYGELWVRDARGALLGASLGVDAGRIRLRVDDAHARYPLLVDPLVWREQQKLVASDGAANDSFGLSVAVSGDTAVVGAAWAASSGLFEAGAAYVFVRSGSVWSEQQKRVASDAAPGNWFGNADSVTGDTAVVGAFHSAPSGHMDAGAVYVFVRSGSLWSEQQKLVASDAAEGDLFGCSVSVSSDTAVVGALGAAPLGLSQAGAAYVFARRGGVWSEQQKLVASDGAELDSFGNSVSVDGDTAVVGAAWAAPSGLFEAGAAYLFARSGSVWSEQRKLVASDATARNRFGFSVSVSAETTVVGAVGAAPLGLSGAGAAYMFARSGSLWSEQQKLVASDAAPDNWFGNAVSVSTDTALVGAGGAAPLGLPGAGAAYVFARSGSLWSEQQKLVASDATPLAWFGYSVSASGDTAVVGAPRAGLLGRAPAGAAYALRVALADGSPCTTAGECHSGLCIDGGCASGDAGADVDASVGADAAMSPPDASMGNDSGILPMDAGAGVDAGTAPPTGNAGCGCHAAGEVADRANPLSAIAVVALLWLRRRRRRTGQVAARRPNSGRGVPNGTSADAR